VDEHRQSQCTGTVGETVLRGTAGAWVDEVRTVGRLIICKLHQISLGLSNQGW
jgi:hypothetical protein